MSLGPMKCKIHTIIFYWEEGSSVCGGAEFFQVKGGTNFFYAKGGAGKIGDPRSQTDAPLPVKNDSSLCDPKLMEGLSL